MRKSPTCKLILNRCEKQSIAKITKVPPIIEWTLTVYLRHSNQCIGGQAKRRGKGIEADFVGFSSPNQASV